MTAQAPDPGVVIVSQVSPIPPAAQAATPPFAQGGLWGRVYPPNLRSVAQRGSGGVAPLPSLSLPKQTQPAKAKTGTTAGAPRLEKGEENCYTGARETHYNNERRYHSCSSTKSVCWTG